MNIVATTITDFFLVHHGFNIVMLDDLAGRYGFKIFAQRCTNAVLPELKNTVVASVQTPSTYCDYTEEQSDIVKAELHALIKETGARTVMSLVDIFFPMELIPADIRKTYFIRNCWAKHAEMFPSEKVNKWAEIEASYIDLADYFVTDSENSARVFEHYYGMGVDDIILPVIDPRIFRMESPSEFVPLAYNVGRSDKQKGLHHLRAPDTFDFMFIGSSTVDSEYLPDWMYYNYGQKPLDEYKPLIKNASYGLFPATWESNGYAVQECLAMGKIPVVQRRSGGNLKYLTNENSIIIDFETESWEDAIMTNLDRRESMMNAAANTITEEMYLNGLHSFIKWVL